MVASLIFVGIQLRPDQKIAAGQYAYYWLNAKIEFSGLIAENKEIWIAGLNGDELSQADSALFEIMASNWIGFQTARYLNRQLISDGDADTVALDVRVSASPRRPVVCTPAGRTSDLRT